MARRNKSAAENTVSLFPFLSILACVIGTLTLMITALALGQMDDPVLASLDQLDTATRKAAADRLAIIDLQTQLEKARQGASQSQQDVVKKREELAALRKEVADIRTQQKQVAANPLPVSPEAEAAALQKQVDDLKKQIVEQEKSEKHLKAQVAQRKKPPEEAVVRVRPTGSGSNFQPTFVECTTGSVLIYNGKKPHRVPRGQVGTDAKYLELLKRVAAAENETVIFLVRDDAITTYTLASRVAKAHYARNGKIPVIGHGRIDLTLFETKK